MKNITIAYSLIGLYYSIVQGYNGKHVRRVELLGT
ncbi:hypothetical protein ACFVR1_14640 [Psychrobacillus sp. NPDC058041]